MSPPSQRARSTETSRLPVSPRTIHKADWFHAARVGYINLLLENGDITPKEVQELARHSTLNMTINVYGRANEQRLRSAVERVGDVVLSKEKCVPSVYGMPAGPEQESATPLTTEGCASSKLAPLAQPSS